MVSRRSAFRSVRKEVTTTALCVALLAAAGCALAPAATPTAAVTSATTSVVTPASPALFDASGRSAERAALLARLHGATYVLLGEVHDNPAHHRARAELLRELLADGRPTRVVFEQIDREHNAAIAALPAGRARDVDAVVAAGQLDKKGWGWPLHRPLFEAALNGGASVVGGNLSRADATQVVRSGAARVPADLGRWFDAGNAAARWSATQAETQRREVDDGHCHALPPAMLAPMALAQRARDAALAQAMLAAPAGVRVVLIAGNGHVRSDIGVPHYLRSSGVAAQASVSVGFAEEVPTLGATNEAGVDFIGVTEGVERADPCEGFKAPPPKGLISPG